MAKNVYLVGHCGPDSTYLAQAVKAACADVIVSRVNDDATLQRVLTQKPGPDLLLINRQLDGLFATYEGINLIADIHQNHPAVKLMLISNYLESQMEAQAAGALPGFGKSELRTAKAKQHLTAALGV